MTDVTRWIARTDVLELAKAVLLASGDLSRSKVNAAKHIEPVLLKPVGDKLVSVCRDFVELQEQRHDADYNRSYDVDRRIALNAVNRAGDALRALWELYAERDENTVLLLRLSFGATRVARTRQ